MNNKEEEESSLWGILNGKDSLKFSFDIELESIIYIAVAVFVVGIMLIAISKAWPSKH